MLIRHLKKEELPQVEKIGRDFFNAAKRPGEYSQPHFEGLWRGLFDAGMALFLVAEQDGDIKAVFGAMVVEDPYSGDKVAVEQFWYCDPAARGSVGIRLFNQFEVECAKRGVKRILMAHLHNLTPEPLRKLYERRGYKVIETIYEKTMKEIN